MKWTREAIIVDGMGVALLEPSYLAPAVTYTKQFTTVSFLDGMGVFLLVPPYLPVQYVMDLAVALSTRGLATSLNRRGLTNVLSKRGLETSLEAVDE